MAHHRFQVGPHSVAAQIVGPEYAPTFILIHGIGVSGRYFTPLIEELARQFRVVCFDLPGFGRSSRPKPALGITALADVVTTLIRQQGWHNPILVGQSMGCQIVTMMLARHPQLATKAVLISPTTNAVERTAWQQSWRLLQDTMREPLSANLIVFGDYLRCGVPRYLTTLRFMLADRIEDRLPDCRATVLVVRGGRDRIVPHRWAATITARLPHGSLVEISSAPHLVQYTAATEVAKLCADLATQS